MLIKFLTPKKIFCFLIAVSLFLFLRTNVSQASTKHTFGVVALTNVASISILDEDTRTATGPLLTGQLGEAASGDVLDVVISPDGETTLVSNFSEYKVYFIDTSDLDSPEVLGSVSLSFPPEDMDITPDGRYVLVSDGGSSTEIAVIDVENRTLIEEFEDLSIENQAVAVAPDGETVLTVDTDNAMINAFTLSDSGHLTYVASTDVSNGGTLEPMNVTISPDGETAIVSVIADDPSNMVFPVLTITGPGLITLSDTVTPSSSIEAVQSAVFNHGGTKVYLYGQQEDVDTNVVVVLNVSAAGVFTDSGTLIDSDFENASWLYGVDALALDNSGDYLYISNFSPSSSDTFIQVVDVDSNTVFKTINFDPVSVGNPSVETSSIPVGITFWLSDIAGWFEDGESGTDYDLKLSSISGLSVKDADSEIDSRTKNRDKKIKVITTDKNRPTISFELIDEDDNDVGISEYDIQIQYTDVLKRRLDSYRTWLGGIAHKELDESQTKYRDGFEIKYSGSPKDKVNVKPISKELKDGTYYVRVRAYDNADKAINSKEVKLIIVANTTEDLTIATLGSITYDFKYAYYYYNSNLLTITGTAGPDKQIDLYQNDEKLTQVTAGTDGKYSINYSLENGVHDLKLVEGQNSIAFALNIDSTSQSIPADLLTEN